MGLLALPGFLLVVGLMYWSLPLGAICLYIPVWKLWGTTNYIYEWCRFLIEITGVKLKKYGSQGVYRGGPCLYLSNHRSWTDFFLDSYLVEGRAQTMSRMAVAYVFPMFMIPVCLLRGCIVFKRGAIADKQAFNKWLDKCIAASPHDSLLIFPEGHRSTLPHSLPLKRGIIHYAHSRKLPIQIVITQHKESLISEKQIQVGFGITCVTGYSEVIKSADYPDFEVFWKVIEASWQDMWVKVYSADATSLPPLVLEPANLAYTLRDRVTMSTFTPLALVLMCLLIKLCASAYLALVAPLAAVQPLLYQVAAWFPVWITLLSILTHIEYKVPKPTLNTAGKVLAGSSEKHGKAS